MAEKKDIEIEFRGPLTKQKHKDILQFFKKHGKFKTTKKRLLIDYSTLLPGQGIRNRSKDIRLRITNGIPEMIIKVGSWGGSENRKEVSLKTEKGTFDSLVQIFGLLGYTKGVVVKTVSEVYDYKGIEFALVTVMDKRYIFEAEKMAHASENSEKVKKEIEKVLDELEIKPYTNEEFYQYIEELNNGITEVFDFKNHTDTYFKDKFKI